MKQSFHIRVWQTKYEDYPCFSFYDVTGTEKQDVKMGARKQFAEDFGFDVKDTDAYIINSKPVTV
jgi:hypothetical protein